MTAATMAGEPVATRRSWLTLIAMTGSLSMIMLDQTVVSVSLPTMARDLPLSAAGAQWVVNAYVLAMAAAVALGGKLGSKLGPVTTFRVGVIGFLVASACCGLAPNSACMILARVAQGVGAALMMPVTASIVMAAFPASVRGRAMGAYVGISQIFLALGPLIGGTLTEWWTWRAVFWVNVPVGLAALLLVRRAAPANPTQRGLRISAGQTLMLMTGVGATVYALQQSSAWHWTSPATIGVLGGGVIVLAMFVWLQLRDRDPLVDVRLFTNRAFVGDSVVLFATQFGMLAMTLYASLYAQNLLGYSPITAGLSALAMILPLMIGAQVAGRWYDRSGARPPLLLGLTLATVGAGMWALALPDLAFVSKIPGMALVGLGLGLVFSPINTDALSRVAPSDRPQASGIVQTLRQLGGTLGVAVIGSVILSHEDAAAAPAARLGNVAHAMTYGFWLAAAVFATGLALSWWLLPRRDASSINVGALEALSPSGPGEIASTRAANGRYSDGVVRAR
jgi:EmrB/QacA subfamily drug resistance transporter